MSELHLWPGSFLDLLTAHLPELPIASSADVDLRLPNAVCVFYSQVAEQP